MYRHDRPALTRRAFLASSSAISIGATLRFDPSHAAPAAGLSVFRLQAAARRLQLLPEGYPETAVWCFGGRIPGPEIRVKQGEHLRIIVENGLDEETTVHWHGLRVPNAMDGVPHLTQKPIGPGERFVYEFGAVDAGTFWYHPHQRSSEQVERGLCGALIIEEREPIRVDRDVTWVLDDWRLRPSGEISDDFGNRHDEAHNGRVGNTVTINGRVPDSFAVRTGERIRLRLINAANARIFALDLATLQPQITALDGQPVTPHAPERGRIVLAPAMRADLILDMRGRPGSRFTVTDRFYKGLEYKLVDIAYSDSPLREQVPDWPIALAANPLSEPDLADAQRHDVTFTGGMMGAIVMREMGRRMTPGMMGGMRSMMEMMHSGKVWFINGVAAEGHIVDPMLTLVRGRSYVLALTNATAWHHPMHLHGHCFRVISRNGAPTRHQEWQDTVLMAPKERVEIAFVADNPGDGCFTAIFSNIRPPA